MGELTGKGYHQEIQNGKAMRETYIDRLSFLPKRYEDSPSSFYFRSDDEPRTIKSGQGLVNGLYPPHSSAQVIPWHLIEAGSGILVHYC